MYMSEKKYDYKKAISTYKHAFNGIWCKWTPDRTGCLIIPHSHQSIELCF